MHESVMAWAGQSLTAAEVAGTHVVEAGAFDVNGSARPYIESLAPASYTGVDMRPGPRVDRVMDAATLGENCADLVVSFEMLEHVQDWRAAMTGLIGAVKPGGLLLVTTRSRGFGYHGYPHDYWRYSTDQMRHILKSAGMDVLEVRDDPQAPGVFAKALKPACWALPEDLHEAWDAAGDLAL
jgi:SAM-dependent methyltransferase